MALVQLGETAIGVYPRWHIREVDPSDRQRFGQLCGRSLAMRHVFALLERLAPSNATVLVEGESCCWTGWHHGFPLLGIPGDETVQKTLMIGHLSGMKILYVVEGGNSPRTINAYDVSDDGMKLSNKRAAITAEDNGSPDGFRLDIDGNLWCGWGTGEGLDGVSIFNPQGKLIGRIDLPERCANLCFGGRYRNRLFMAASTSVYSLYVNTQGVAYA